MMLRHVMYAAVILCFLVAHGIAFLKINATASNDAPAPIAVTRSGD